MARRKPPKQVYVYMDDYGQLCEVSEKASKLQYNNGVVAKYVRVDRKPKQKKASLRQRKAYSGLLFAGTTY